VLNERDWLRPPWLLKTLTFILARRFSEADRLVTLSKFRASLSSTCECCVLLISRHRYDTIRLSPRPPANFYM